MIRKWYLRFVLWYWAICPKHGPHYEGCGPGGMFSYCDKCNQARQQKRKARLNQIQTEYNS